MNAPRGPLWGKRILVTRAAEGAGDTAAILRARGAVPLVVPMITLAPPSDWRSAVVAMARLGASDWVVFTSASGVSFTRRALEEAGLGPSAFGAAKIAAIGGATAEALRDELRLHAAIVPADARGEGLADEIVAATRGAGAKVMILRAEVAREVLPDALRAAGCDVEIVAMYATRGPDPVAIAHVAAALSEGRVDVVTFTSGSTVDNLCRALGASASELLAKTFVASIGPVTSEACSRHRVRVDLTAGAASLLRLIEDLEFALSQ